MSKCPKSLLEMCLKIAYLTSIKKWHITNSKCMLQMELATHK